MTLESILGERLTFTVLLPVTLPKRSNVAVYQSRKIWVCVRFYWFCSILLTKWCETLSAITWSNALQTTIGSAQLILLPANNALIFIESWWLFCWTRVYFNDAWKIQTTVCFANYRKSWTRSILSWMAAVSKKTNSFGVSVRTGNIVLRVTLMMITRRQQLK